MLWSIVGLVLIVAFIAALVMSTGDGLLEVIKNPGADIASYNVRKYLTRSEAIESAEQRAAQYGATFYIFHRKFLTETWHVTRRRAGLGRLIGSAIPGEGFVAAD
jgi:hypothetical protein